MMTSRPFEGLVVVVAGGGAGLGRRYAEDLGKAGASVVVGGRSTNVDEVAASIQEDGGEAVGSRADVRDGAKFIDAAISTFGRVDGLVVNAGIVCDRSFIKMSDEDWDRVVDVSLDGARACAAAAWPHMLAQQSGRIVLTSSGAGLYGNFGQSNYAAGKAAVLGLMRTLALEGASKNVLVNAIAPMASTDMTKGVFDEDLKEALPPAGVSPFVLALLHPTCRENGAIIEAGGGWAAKIRLQRSAGLRLPSHQLDVMTVLDRWGEIVDFAEGVAYPSSTAECLAAARGTR